MESSTRPYWSGPTRLFCSPSISFAQSFDSPKNRRMRRPQKIIAATLVLAMIFHPALAGAQGWIQSATPAVSSAHNTQHAELFWSQALSLEALSELQRIFQVRPFWPQLATAHGIPIHTGPLFMGAESGGRGGPSGESHRLNPPISQEDEFNGTLEKEYLLKALGVEWQSTAAAHPKGWSLVSIPITEDNDTLWAGFMDPVVLFPGDTLSLILQDGRPRAIYHGPQEGTRAFAIVLDQRYFSPDEALNKLLKNKLPFMYGPAYELVQTPWFNKPIVTFRGVFRPMYPGEEGEEFNSSGQLMFYFPNVKDKTGLDAGTGTGIAALRAIQKGARHVVAYDANPLAVWNARLNAARMGVAPEQLDIIPWEESSTELPKEGAPYDFILSCPPGPKSFREHERISHLVRQNYGDPDQHLIKTLLREGAALLRAGGRLYLSYTHDLKVVNPLFQRFPQWTLVETKDTITMRDRYALYTLAPKTEGSAALENPESSHIESPIPEDRFMGFFHRIAAIVLSLFRTSQPVFRQLQTAA